MSASLLENIDMCFTTQHHSQLCSAMHIIVFKSVIASKQVQSKYIGATSLLLESTYVIIPDKAVQLSQKMHLNCQNCIPV